MPRADVATLKKIANPLKLGVMHEQAFVLSREWPDLLTSWLQGSAAGTRPGVVVAPPADGTGEGDAGVRSGQISAVATAPPAADADITVDYVGSAENAAKVIAALHKGEKRLVFCDFKRLVERLGAQLRERGVTTHLIHASLSPQERRRAELAFAGGRDCVIVSASALEPGLDAGDLDRVIRVNAPLTVAGFLQRLGRTGRRPGTRRNCLFPALREDALLRRPAPWQTPPRGPMT